MRAPSKVPAFSQKETPCSAVRVLIPLLVEPFHVRPCKPNQAVGNPPWLGYTIPLLDRIARPMRSHKMGVPPVLCLLLAK